MKQLYFLIFLAYSTFSIGQNCGTVTNDTSQPITSTEIAMPTVEVTDDVTITDINVTVNIRHNFIGDLSINLQSPLGTSVPLIIANGCDGENITDAVFDNDGNSLDCSSGIPPGTYIPEGDLSLFNGESSAGTWTLIITDTLPLDDGQFNSFTLEFCTDEVLATNSFDLSSVSLYPNPANDIIALNLGSYTKLSVKIYNILGKTVLQKDVSSQDSKMDIASLATGAYLLQLTTQDGQQTTKKLIKR